jgi:hypothetical protein
VGACVAVALAYTEFLADCEAGKPVAGLATRGGHPRDTAAP